MKVEEALPMVFKRAFPVLEEGTTMLVAGTALDIPRRDVIPIVSAIREERKISFVRRREGCLAFSGYSMIQHLLRTEPGELYRFLFEPCERATVPFTPVDSRRTDLGSLIGRFASEGFGWAFLERDPNTHARVSLADLIPLYGKGVLSTRIRVRDVATQKVLTLPGKTRLREALRMMTELRVRRVFVGETGAFVSDREVLIHILSPERLGVLRNDPRAMLESTLDEVKHVKPVDLDPDAELPELAPCFKDESGACCGISSAGILTPWDMIVKPWQLGRLTVDGIAQAARQQNDGGVSVAP